MSQNKGVRNQWLKRFAFDKPVVFSILVILVAGLLTEIPFDAALASVVGDPDAEFFKVLIGHTGTGLLLVGLLLKLDMFKRAGFTRPSQWKAVWLVWPLGVMALLFASSLFDGSLTIDSSRPGLLVLYIAVNLAIGFCEEVLGRGVVLSVMLQKWGHTRRGIYQAVLVSSALFGVSHIFNLITGRQPLLADLTQIIYSVFFGVIFAACFLRNNAIWPVMLMHAAVDFGGSLRHIAVEGSQIAVANNTPTQAISALIITLPLFLYGLFVLRKVAPGEKSGITESSVFQTAV
jgi:membrane protease YdiL (CAAX protease family)